VRSGSKLFFASWVHTKSINWVFVFWKIEWRNEKCLPLIVFVGKISSIPKSPTFWLNWFGSIADDFSLAFVEAKVDYLSI
jgi:hypothetical protein